MGLEIILDRKQKTSRTQLILLIPFLVISLFALALSYRLIEKEEEIRRPAPDGKVAVPIISSPAGFYTSEVKIKLASPSGGEIYYTLDGSNPLLSTQKYTEPILITSREDEPNHFSEIKNSPVFLHPLKKVFKGTILRAIAVVNDTVSSTEARATFFIHPQGRGRYTLPVISLVADADSLFGYKNGIYVNGATTDDKDYYLRKALNIADNKAGFPANYKRGGSEWERPVSIEYFDLKKTLAFSAKAGVMIHGNATRERPQKSLKLFFPSRYKEAAPLKYGLFGKPHPKEFQSLLLRAAGQDMYKTFFRDALAQSLVKNTTNLDFQDYKPSILFINGEYWGVHNLRDRIDKFYFFYKYKIPDDSLVLISPSKEHNHVPAIENGTESDLQNYLGIIKYANQSDLSLQNNYEWVKSVLDVDDFIDYLIFNIYIGNWDWPHNNVILWRYRGTSRQERSPKDGRFRFVIYDADYTLGNGHPAKLNMFDYLLKKNEGDGVRVLFKALMKNKEFQQTFINRFKFHLNSSLTKEKILATVSAFEKRLAPEMQEHIDRWRTMNSVSAWHRNVEDLRKYVVERDEFQKQQLEGLEASLTKSFN